MVTIVVAALVTNRSFSLAIEGVHKRLDDICRRLDAIEARLAALETRVAMVERKLDLAAAL